MLSETHLAHDLRLLAAEPWAIYEPSLHALVEALRIGPAEVSSRFGGGETPRLEGRVAVIPLKGVIDRTGRYGGASAEGVSAWIGQALRDPGVDGILLDVSSPGGSVTGTPELSDRLFSSRGSKPIVAYTPDLMASGAYFAASAADAIVAEQTALVGSIGVYTLHADFSGLLGSFGIRTTFIQAGRHKTDENWLEPLGAQGRASAQERIDAAYEMFVGHFPRNRGIDRGRVESDFGQGKVFFGLQAQQRGLIDQVGSFADALALAATPRGQAAGNQQKSQSPVRSFGGFSVATPETNTAAQQQQQPAPPPAPVIQQPAVLVRTAEAGPAAPLNLEALVEARAAEIIRQQDEVRALCASQGSKRADEFLRLKLSKAEVMQVLLDDSAKRFALSAPATHDAPTQQPDPKQKVREEYRAHAKLAQSFGLSEDDYAAQDLPLNLLAPVPALSS